MFRDLIGPHAPAWIAPLATAVTVFSVAVFGLALLYVLFDNRRAHRDRMSALPLDEESTHV